MSRDKATKKMLKLRKKRIKDGTPFVSVRAERLKNLPKTPFLTIPTKRV